MMGNGPITGQDIDFMQEKQQIKEMENELQVLILQNNRFLKENKALKKENEYLKTQIRSSQIIFEDHSNNNKLENTVTIFRDSYSIRAGQIFVGAVSKPGKNTIMMPFRLIGLMFEIYFARKA